MSINLSRVIPELGTLFPYWSVGYVYTVDGIEVMNPQIAGPFFTLEEARHVRELAQAKYPEREICVFACGSDFGHLTGKKLSDLDNPYYLKFMMQVISTLDSGKTEEEIRYMHYAIRDDARLQRNGELRAEGV